MILIKTLDRWWALALPTYLCVLVLFVLVLYIGYNFVSTNPLRSLFTVQGMVVVAIVIIIKLRPTSLTHGAHMADNFSNRSGFEQAMATGTVPCDPSRDTIPDAYDIPISLVNSVLYGVDKGGRQGTPSGPS